eukprot:4540585-Pyramimonas_sp.AAC.1
MTTSSRVYITSTSSTNTTTSPTLEKFNKATYNPIMNHTDTTTSNSASHTQQYFCYYCLYQAC